MGMFDYVKCEYPLPMEGAQNWLFQTKDTDCELKTYTITADGRLVKDEYDLEECPKAERPYPDAPEDDFRSLIGILRPCNKRKVEIPFDGDIHFYDYREDEDPKWVEFRATFRNGRVTEMKQVAGA